MARRVIVHYKPSRPTRSLFNGKVTPTGKPARRMFRANTTKILDEAEAAAIKAAAEAAGIVADFTFQVVQDLAEAVTGLDLPELSVKDPVTKAVGELLDPDGDGKLGAAQRQAARKARRAARKAAAEAPATEAPADAPKGA